jgi:hypothetical protein
MTIFALSLLLAAVAVPAAQTQAPDHPPQGAIAADMIGNDADARARAAENALAMYVALRRRNICRSFGF